MESKRDEYFRKTKCPLCNSSKFSKLFSKTVAYKFVFDNKPITFTVVKCDSCGLQYMNPVINSKGLKEIYNKEYLAILNTYNIKDKTLKDMRIEAVHAKMRHIVKKTGLKSGKLLDFGCGNGEFIKENKKMFPKWNFYGYDFNESAEKTSKNTWLGPSITSTKLEKGSFDVITMFEVVEHFTELHKTFEEISSYIKKGGYIYIETGNNASLISRIKKDKHFYYDIYHTIYFSRKTIRKLLEDKGFRIVDMSDDVLNGYLYMFRKNKNPVLLVKGVAYWFLSKLKIGNFAVTGGMAVLAQKN
jgi:2-polyprenyl-3-methyl-5-hydroxy-6-metoxy-1,4-benzoquinol methylase